MREPHLLAHELRVGCRAAMPFAPQPRELGRRQRREMPLVDRPQLVGQLHGGALKIRSTEGVGTIVSVRIPVKTKATGQPSRKAA